MYSRRYVLALLIGLGIALSMTLGAACSHSTGGGGGTLSQLDQDTGVRWTATVDPRYGNTAYLFPSGTPTIVGSSGQSPSEAAMAFFAKYGGIFGIVDATKELAPESSSDTPSLQFATFTQTEGGAWVYGTRLTVVFDGSGHISHIIGTFIPKLNGFSTVATITPAQAASNAQTDLKQGLPTGLPSALEDTGSPLLTIYEPPGSPPSLAYMVVVSYALDNAVDTVARQRCAALYIVDANSGAFLQTYDHFPTQYEGANVKQIPGSGKPELAPAGTRSFPVLATADAGETPTAPYYMQLNAGSPSVPRLFVRSPGDGGAVLTSPNQPFQGARRVGSSAPYRTV